MTKLNGQANSARRFNLHFAGTSLSFNAADHETRCWELMQEPKLGHLFVNFIAGMLGTKIRTDRTDDVTALRAGLLNDLRGAFPGESFEIAATMDFSETVRTTRKVP